MTGTEPSIGSVRPTRHGDPRISDGARRRSGVASGLNVLLVTIGLGALTDYGQTRLPALTGSLANSSGSWVLVTFLLALLSPSTARAMAWGVISLIGMVAGYYITASARGVAESSRSIAFWALCAVLCGPGVGGAAAWVRRGTPRLAAVGAGLLTGLLIGEGVFGVTENVSSTSSVYWGIQIAVGSVIIVAVDVVRVRHLCATALSVVVAGIVGGATTEIYTRLATLQTLIAHV